MTGERVERRLAAVLAADVAGYSRLMGADEEGTLARLKVVRKAIVDPTIAKHRGRIVKTTGDGMLVEFASAVDAVRSAVEVQRNMAAQNADVSQDIRIEFRIGIHLGDIIIDESDIFGDGVNIAARLEGIAEPGGVCLSDDTYRQIRGKIEIVCDDLGPQNLKNISEPMRAWQVRIAGAASNKLKSLYLTTLSPPLALPDKPSIAVLPFQNMSGDPDQEYFADGMVEDIITALSRFKSLFVIARNSSFTYKGKAVDIKQVGRELGVRYVLEGSVRKIRGKVRITGQLIDATTGAHIWAEKIDGTSEDIFELQDEVTMRVVGAIEPSITNAEIDRARVKATSNLDAYELYLRALSLQYSLSRQDVDNALTLLNQAITLDPSYSWAKAFAASLHCLRLNHGWETSEELSRGKALALEALRSSGNDPQTIATAAHAHAWLSRDFEAALVAMDRAILLNSHSAAILMKSGWLRTWVADADLAIEHFSRAIRLNPIDPMLGYVYGGLAYAFIIKGDCSKALEYARRTTQEMPQWLSGWLAVIVAAAIGGDLQMAHKAKDRLLEIQPTFSIDSYNSQNAVIRDARTREIMNIGMRLAGLPEAAMLSNAASIDPGNMPPRSSSN